MSCFNDGIIRNQYDDWNAFLPPEPLKVFFSYAHEDEAFRNLLGKHLASFANTGFITQWYDGDIQAGIEWAEEVYRNLNTADVILLLVSPDFMASDFCYHVEMNQALKRHFSKDALVLPILLRPTYWKHTPIGTLQVLPRGERPVSKWRSRDEAFLNIIIDIFGEIKLLLSQQWVEKSNIYKDTEHYEHALVACEKAIFLNHRNISAYMSKGSLLWHLERYEEVLKVYEQIILIEPNNIIAHMTKSYTLWTLGRYQAALFACEKVISLDPNNAFAYLLKGALHKILSDQAYQRARQIGLGEWRDFLENKHIIVKPDLISFLMGKMKQIEQELGNDEKGTTSSR